MSLKQSLQKVIAGSGPISVASYMKQSLIHPTHGYYVTRDPLGAKGDFITSPEISQMFGELIGVNLVTQWMAQGRPSEIRIAELGPGRGTLMSDLLRASRTFKDFYASIKEVSMVEASPELQKKQGEALTEHEGAMKIQWLDATKELSVDKVPTFIVAHEFFDALPIHQFEKAEDGAWRERLVDYDSEKDAFKLVLGSKNSFLNSALAAQKRFSVLPAGSSVEVSPESWQISDDIVSVLRSNTGSALIIDYGPMATIPVNTFRAFKEHHQVDPFTVNPGEADLTADVDFRALGDIFRAAGLHVQGPVSQADWLHRMGIGARATVLANNQKDIEGKQRVAKAYERLVDPLNMGKTYKFLVATTQKEPVAGF